LPYSGSQRQTLNRPGLVAALAAERVGAGLPYYAMVNHYQQSRASDSRMPVRPPPTTLLVLSAPRASVPGVAYLLARCRKNLHRQPERSRRLQI